MSLNKIIDAIASATESDSQHITPSTRLDSLGIDSLKAINILYDLEEEFDIEVPNEEIAELTTVHDIEVAINKLLEAK